MSQIHVKKSNGEIEVFDREKLKKSLINSEASVFLANEIVKEIESTLVEGITTSEIYREAFVVLKKKEIKTAMKYSLRRSLLTLGPTGFPFEKFIAKILEEKGYSTATGVILKGACIKHEVDVVAYDEHNLILSEVKFHNELSTKTDTKVALYVHSRYQDLASQTFTFENKKFKPNRGLVITNTKFTNNAIKYAKCVDLDLIGWDYPKKGNLYDLMDETGLHPITALASLAKGHKTYLIEKGIVNCASIRNNTNLLKDLGFDGKKIARVLEEVHTICSK